MDFIIPSEFAKKTLYYCPQFGHFYCDNRYRVERDTLDLFLLMYVRHGTLGVETLNHTYIVREGEAVLLDCRNPHAYYSKDSLDFLWFHFNGNSSSEYATYLYEKVGIVFSGVSIASLNEVFSEIFHRARMDIVNEHRISLAVNQALCCLADTAQNPQVMNDLIRPATDYIHSHYQEQINLDQLAQMCRVSVAHLVRVFKKHINCTPHEYLLTCRLHQAKQHLTSSEATIEEIAEQCGFNSASHFARAFRRSSGITPSEFRKMQF